MPSCGRGWEQLRLTEDDVETHFNNGETNIGVILGPPSGGLVDIDLDCPESLRLARFVLPKTELRFGRESTPDSHWLYKAPIEGRTAYTDPIYAKRHWSKSAQAEAKINSTKQYFRQACIRTASRFTGRCDGDPLEIVDSTIDRQCLAVGGAMLDGALLAGRRWPARLCHARCRGASARRYAGRSGKLDHRANRKRCTVMMILVSAVSRTIRKRG